jgi:hypothetical protein
VVNQSKEEGDFKAIAVKRTVQTGKRLVARVAVLVYISKTLDPRDFSSSGEAAA